MRNKNEKSPAKRPYCVWADYVSRVYQEVDATSPQRAFRLAQRQPGRWQNCFEFEDSDSYHLSNQVQDVETEERFVIGRVDYCCKTCGSEIVEIVNESNFKEGECGPCEYARYKSQKELLEALKSLREDIRMLRDGEWVPDRENDKACNASIYLADDAIDKAYGRAA
jgi:hypothetical protein